MVANGVSQNANQSYKALANLLTVKKKPRASTDYLHIYPVFSVIKYLLYNYEQIKTKLI